MLRASLYKLYKIITFFLILVGIGFLARVEIHAASPSPTVIRSKQGEGLWKDANFDGYWSCAYPSASQCLLDLYSPANDWITPILIDGSSWGVKNFSVHDAWWYDSSSSFACAPSLDTSTKMINVSQYFNGINGLTGLYRRKFDLTIPSGYQIKNATLKMLSDNKTAVYLNGTEVVSNREGCYSVDIGPDLFLEGADKNIFAIQLSNDNTNNLYNPMGLGYELTINYKEAPPPPMGTIAGRVWNDVDGDGIEDPEDFNKFGVPVAWSGLDFGGMDTNSSFSGNNFTSPDLRAGSYTVTVDPGSWSLTAKSCPDLLIPSCTVAVSDGVTSDVWFGIWNNPSSWLQAKNADVYAGGGISISVPSSEWFIDADSDTNGGGVAISGNPTLSANGRLSRRPNGDISAPGWGLSGYNHASINWNEFSEAGGSLVERHPSGFIINALNKDSYVSGLRVVIVEDGNLIISGGVTNLSGVFVVQNGELIIEDGASHQQLEIKGMLYAKDLIIHRTLANNTAPAVVVEYDPSYLLQNIPGLTNYKISWKEVK